MDIVNPIDFFICEEDDQVVLDSGGQLVALNIVYSNTEVGQLLENIEYDKSQDFGGIPSDKSNSTYFAFGACAT
jgi:hypothetical protein